MVDNTNNISLPYPVLMWLPRGAERIDDGIAWNGVGRWAVPRVSNLLNSFLKIRDTQGARRFVERYGPFRLKHDCLAKHRTAGSGFWDNAEREATLAMLEPVVTNHRLDADTRSMISGWLAEGVSFGSNQSHPPQLVMYASTSGILAYQLLALCAGHSTLTICSVCGRPYGRTARQQTGRANYCDGCRGTRGAAFRQRRRRTRMREEAMKRARRPMRKPVH